MEQRYLEQLSPQERKAYDIAKSHLGTSFNILRSNGYKSWIKSSASMASSTSASSSSASSGNGSSSSPLISATESSP